MPTLRQDAVTMVQNLPENQLHFVMKIMRELSRHIPMNDKVETQKISAKEQAFQVLESMRRQIPDLDYTKELAEYREEKYI